MHSNVLIIMQKREGSHQFSHRQCLIFPPRTMLDWNCNKLKEDVICFSSIISLFSLWYGEMAANSNCHPYVCAYVNTHMQAMKQQCWQRNWVHGVMRNYLNSQFHARFGDTFGNLKYKSINIRFCCLAHHDVAIGGICVFLSCKLLMAIIYISTKRTMYTHMYI